MTGPVAAVLDDQRLHLQHGPIDLIIEAFGTDIEVRRSYAQAWSRFKTVLEELVAVLPQLRSVPAGDAEANFSSPVARAMASAVSPFTSVFVTPMAAVAGAVADEILSAMLRGRRLSKAYVNNGGDISVHLADGQSFEVGLIAGATPTASPGTVKLCSAMEIGGLATSGRGGRSQSLGIADAVTVVARTSAQADVAATLIANAVDLPAHPAVQREPANTRYPDSDLGEQLVTVALGPLTADEIETALHRGMTLADELCQKKLIRAAVLSLCGEARVCQVSPSSGSYLMKIGPVAEPGVAI